MCGSSRRRRWTFPGPRSAIWFIAMAGRSLEDLKKLQRNQLKAITKDDLIEAILTTESGSEVAARLEDRLTSIANELAGLRQAITNSETAVNNKMAEMQQNLDKQGEIIMKQQLFLEQIDRKERETNMVILGVPDEEETLEGATSDEDKIRKIWNVIGASTAVQSHRRLGQREPGATRKRPILVVVSCKGDRDNTLAKSPQLKSRGAPYDKIFMKKDVHPSVRREWKRLHDVVTAEKVRPENQGCNISLDVRARKVYRDGVMIDQWNLHHF